MNQRYGGKYSPGARPGQAPLQAARPARSGARVNLLFLLPFILPVMAFRQGPVGLTADLVAFGLLLLAAWLTREGERAHEAWEARTIARRPAIPRKIFGAVLTGLGIGLAAWAPGGGLVAPVLLGILGGGLHLIAFGPDPLSDKGMEGQDAFQTERVATAVAEAEKHLTAMREAARPVADREVMDRLDRFATTARAMFRTVENDPRDLTTSRKYLSVYLDGARAATAQFARIYGTSRDPQARADYLALLDDLNTRFTQKADALLSNDRNRMDVEIEVLRERLAQEAPRS
ncbi:5-bromo-4-chloroindolyl phosphate hydrolysis family protein [Gemmobacter sp.]|uniref:5-bromo-4-chloroindolyl phosphate hydrolysis family protein n=1 Tax=Gemmobacter sp. TaxID=1898957 RepID=UPI002AFE79B8|nr:5-bromo-4-chloroindolyl phosphate hydrolysis family protein [Gemmobacter sp.]